MSDKKKNGLDENKVREVELLFDLIKDKILEEKRQEEEEGLDDEVCEDFEDDQ